ncbi:MAG TPA: FkbM family methyltransferase [Vicinamibacterales bacterium]|nr:FkbM family methyltransferase [Vicinamibacterales bacterium]
MLVPSMVTDHLYRALSRWPVAQRHFRRVVRRLPGRERRVTHFGRDLIVDPSELHGYYLYYEHAYDDEVFRFLEPRLGAYPHALDLGANIGIYTTFLARHCRHVDAFEPEAQVLARLRRNLEINGADNVTVHEVCVSDASGVARFTSPDRRNQGVGRIDPAGAVVPAVSLDDFLAGATPEPLFIKVDIEGGEWPAMLGARRTLAAWPAPLALLLEIHPDAITGLGGSIAGLRQVFEDAGFDVRGLDAGELASTVDGARFWWVSRGRS